MKTTLLFSSLFFCIISTSFSQSISSSPYSIYGLGTLYDADLGTISSIGGSGIALPSTQFINNLNPASLAYVYHNHFLFDVGGKSIFSTYQNSDKKESRNNIQFSHIAFAFPITSKSAFSATLKPYSSTAYKISNLTLPILNSVENYNLSVTGTGGLNNFDLSYGYLVSKKLALGVTTSLLFGSATDDRNYTIANAVSYINKKTNYNGVRATLGAQFQADSTLTIGIIAKTPTRINASKIQTVASTNSSSTITLESDLASNVDDFYMPLEAGIGFSKAFKNKLNLTLDYERGFWQSTKQSDIYGSFVDRDKISLGFTYKRPKLFGSYFNRIQYAAGLNYDTGYLEVDSHRVSNKSFSVGVSLPIDNTFSALNISYSYGQKAKISDGLIKENYHKISINLCLDGIWFVKRKFE